MRCPSIELIGETIQINGISYTIISAGPLDLKTGCYSIIAKFKVTKELVDQLIQNKTLPNSEI